MIVEQILRECSVDGSQIVGFGDGFVEIEEIRKAGGYAIGVASNEASREGINRWKRDRLVEAGADLIVADYRELDRILDVLF